MQILVKVPTTTASISKCTRKKYYIHKTQAKFFYFRFLRSASFRSFIFQELNWNYVDSTVSTPSQSTCTQSTSIANRCKRSENMAGKKTKQKKTTYLLFLFCFWSDFSTALSLALRWLPVFVPLVSIKFLFTKLFTDCVSLSNWMHSHFMTEIERLFFLVDFFCCFFRFISYFLYSPYVTYLVSPVLQGYFIIHSQRHKQTRLTVHRAA